MEDRDGLRDVLIQLIAMRVAIRTDSRRALDLGDLAIVSETWHMRYASPVADEPRRQESRALSLHRNVDREGWKILLLAPWGFG